MNKKPQLSQMIHEAVDTYPGGICFAMASGRPILVNQTINDLISRLTGHTILNAFEAWSELEALDSCRSQPLPEALLPDREQEGLIFLLPDGSIWRFRKQMLQDRRQQYVQIEATDVTELYRTSTALLESNRKLQELSRRQHQLLADIVQINRENELLQAKMRVHAELGRCLIVTKKALDEAVDDEAAKDIVQAWEDAIRNLANIPMDTAMAQDSMEKELMKVASMIGCQIHISGQRPEDLRTQQLLFAALREALTNAVRHGNANELRVSCEKTGRGYHVEITDNGKKQVHQIHEGSGLSGLRQRLEQEGAVMEIQCDGAVRLVIDLPLAHKEPNGEVVS